MTIKEIERIWLGNFRGSALVKNGFFNPLLAKKLFNGFASHEEKPFQIGFRRFHHQFDYTNGENQLNELVSYLHYIGITISKQSMLDAVQKGACSYKQILKKAYYIFKQLSKYDESLDLYDPYQDNLGDLLFFLELEACNADNSMQLTISEELDLPEFYNKYIELPPGYENNTVPEKLFQLIENSGNSFFLTGKAGTGKSTFIHYFTKNTQKQVLLVAYTGIAAINIGGQTIHSLFRFPLKPLLPNDSDIPIFKSFLPRRKILENTDTIIIDEVSMLRSDLLEGLDYSLRNNGGDPGKLFGGKQLIFVGDPFQLPPIVKSEDVVERELFRLIYKSEYFFDSQAYKQLNPAAFEFEKIHRQQDLFFIELLNRVRDCSINQAGIGKLNERYKPGFVPRPNEFAVMLTTTNFLAKKENTQKLESLPYKSHFFRATITGDFKEDRYPTESLLELKRNAQVMFVRNDSEIKGRRWVNGTIAKVEYVDERRIVIRMKDDTTYTLQKEIWENRQYQWDKVQGRITTKVIGTFEQYPVKLAWAITIHKSQGLTFDKVQVDLGSGTFANGQLYTALSRCRSLEGLTLKRRIRPEDIIEDRRLIEFYEKQIRNSMVIV